MRPTPAPRPFIGRQSKCSTKNKYNHILARKTRKSNGYCQSLRRKTERRRRRRGRKVVRLVVEESREEEEEEGYGL